jgi:hypothetical protein
MKLSEGINIISGRPGEIPDASRNDFPEFFREMGFKSGAEIGVYKGEYTKILASSGLEIYAIDPWRIYRDYGNPRGQKRLDFQYDHTCRYLSDCPNVKIVRKTSLEALEDFPDGSLDFVYIDGNHHFEYVAQDIVEWTRKVRKGGIVSGHDYIYTKSRSVNGGCDVHYIVDAYVKAAKIRNFWVVGRKKYIEGEKRDRWRSWFWIKEKDW